MWLLSGENSMRVHLALAAAAHEWAVVGVAVGVVRERKSATNA